MFRRITCAFALSLCATAVWIAPEGADAKFEQRGAHYCTATEGDPIIFGNFGVMNAGGSYPVNLFCPVNDDSSFRRTEIKTLRVHGRDGSPNGSLIAAACRSYYASVGGACGPGAYSNYWDIRNDTLYPDVSVWNVRPADYSYIFMQLPNQWGYSPSYLHGFDTLDY